MRSFRKIPLRQLVKQQKSLCPKRFYSTEGGEEEDEGAAQQNAVAVVVTGCGYLDGTDVTETVACMVELQKHGFETILASPYGESEVTVNHLTRQPDVNEMRTIQSEVSRINRGRVAPLRAVTTERFNAVVFPGGWGSTNILADLEESGPADFEVHEEVERIIKEFHKEGKAMAFSQLSNILPAKVLGTANGGPGVSVTLGPENDPNAKVITELGNRYAAVGPSDVVVDKDNWMVSTPGFQVKGSNFATTFKGMQDMLSKMKWLMEGGIEETAFGEESYDPEMESAMIKQVGEEEWELLKKIDFIKKHSPMGYSKYVKWEEQEQKKFRDSHIHDDMKLARMSKESRDQYKKEVVEPMQDEFLRRREIVINELREDAGDKAKKRQAQEAMRAEKFGNLFGGKKGKK